jgi:hypothetical protein
VIVFSKLLGINDEGKGDCVNDNTIEAALKVINKIAFGVDER